MPSLLPTTRLQRWTRREVVGLLVVLAALGLALAVAARLAPPVPEATEPSMSDVELYQGVVAGLSGGGSYYEVLGAWLRNGDFPRRPVFNWRFPAVMPVLAWLGASGGRGLLVGLWALAHGVAFWRSREDTSTGLAVALALSAACSTLGVLTAPGLVFAESWAAVLLLLAAALVPSRRLLPLAAAVGALAVLTRETAALGALVLGALSIRREGWRAAAAWGAAGALVLGAYALHWHQVDAHLVPADLDVAPRSWLALGGLGFWDKATAFTGFGLLIPSWLFLPAAGLGLVAGRGALTAQLRAMAAVYGLFFLVAGLPFNGYWGLLWAAPLGVGLAWAPAALGDAVRVLRGVRPPP